MCAESSASFDACAYMCIDQYICTYVHLYMYTSEHLYVFMYKRILNYRPQLTCCVQKKKHKKKGARQAHGAMPPAVRYRRSVFLFFFNRLFFCM